MQKISSLDEKRNLAELFASNFRLLYANRERIWSDPRLYGADVGVAPYGSNGKVGLGAVLHAIDAHPDLFLNGDACIINFAGNPLTGTTENRVVNLRTGVAYSVKSAGFIAKVRALNAATALFPKSEEALPLEDVVKILGEVCH